MRYLDPLYFAPQPKPFGGWICWKDSPSPPPAPDYTGAANATSQGSVQASLVNNLGAHPNIYTPLGSQTWEQTGSASVPGIGGQPGFDVPQYSQTVSMSPDGQNLYNQQMGLSTGLLGLGNSALGRTSGTLGQGWDANSYSKIPNAPTMDPQARQHAEDSAYQSATSRLDPQWARNEASQRTTLANQGLSAGGEAYDNAMRDMNVGKNDAYAQARAQAVQQGLQSQQAQFGMDQGTFNMGLAGNQAGFQQASYLRGLPLSELNAIRTGAQPQMPQFQPSQYSMGAQGPNYSQAAGQQNQYDMGLYNSQVGSQNSMMGGLMSLAGTVGGAMISDRRLKSNIVRIGDHPLGIGIYEYDIFGSRDRGVMAQEVMDVKPEAVFRIGKFYGVDYGRL